jgi:hypothetical protein
VDLPTLGRPTIPAKPDLYPFSASTQTPSISAGRGAPFLPRDM